mmetsp:Transcript_90316/g.156413  ORF Transcript_90316/g.156413 Transcript_90316/m.156413 type:complete len:227 (-) Transcript_90316:10157-10837(-)
MNVVMRVILMALQVRVHRKTEPERILHSAANQTRKQIICWAGFAGVQTMFQNRGIWSCNVTPNGCWIFCIWPQLNHPHTVVGLKEVCQIAKASNVALFLPLVVQCVKGDLQTRRRNKSRPDETDKDLVEIEVIIGTIRAVKGFKPHPGPVSLQAAFHPYLGTPFSLFHEIIHKLDSCVNTFGFFVYPKDLLFCHIVKLIWATVDFVVTCRFENLAGSCDPALKVLK